MPSAGTRATTAVAAADPPAVERFPGLQLEVDLPRQRFDWRVQRLAWALLGALWLAFLLGLLGPGPLGQLRLATPDDALRLEAPRFMRHHSQAQLDLFLQATGRELRLRVSNDWLDAVDLDGLRPEPSEVVAEDGALRLHFDAEPGARLPLRVTIRPARPGSLDGWVSVDDGPRLSFSQFVHP